MNFQGYVRSASLRCLELQISWPFGRRSSPYASDITRPSNPTMEFGNIWTFSGLQVFWTIKRHTWVADPYVRTKYQLQLLGNLIVGSPDFSILCETAKQEKEETRENGSISFLHRSFSISHTVALLLSARLQLLMGFSTVGWNKLPSHRSRFLSRTCADVKAAVRWKSS